MKRIARAPLCALFVFFCCAGVSYAINANQCVYFATGGKVSICHATGSAKNPFVLIETSEQACVNGHADHPGDYVAVGDPTCQGGACLPSEAPCDATLGCCAGLTCVDGTCVAANADTTPAAPADPACQ